MRLLSVVILLAMVTVSTSAAIELPDPPSGFTWYEAKEIKGAFLVPSGWHVSAERDKGTLAWFITEQQLTPPEKFLVGATINAFLGNPSAPSQIQKVVLAQVEYYHVDFGKGSFGPFDTLQCEYDMPATAEHEAIHVFQLAVTHPKTHAAYLVTFESPVDEWSRTWPMGEKILKMLALNGKM